MNPQELTVVITTFHSQDKIFKCLDSIDKRVDIIIVENTNDISFKKNIENKYNNVKCILAGENLGYAKGNNLGLSKVKSKYALILNPDSVVEKNTIENFFLSAKKKPSFAIIAPKIQDEKNYLENDNNKELIEVEKVKGFAMFLNLNQFEKIGFFDDNFFIYLEETDLCRRLRENNKKIYLDPNIRINHLGGSSHNKDIEYEMELSRNWHWMWSTFYYNKKHGNFINALFKVSGKLLSACLKTIFYSITFNKTKKRIYFQR